MIESTALYEQMRLVVNEWSHLPAPQWQALAHIFRVRHVPAQKHMLLPGDYVHELIFVCSGLLRFYYPGADGTESNKAFIAENTFAGPLAASALRLPVIYGIQALEPTTLLVAPYIDFVALFDQHPLFDRLGRRLAEWLLMRKEMRMRHLLQDQAKARYLSFMEQFPDLAARVPQYHIASYLGITEVSISRLKRSLRQEQAAPMPSENIAV